MSQNFVSSYFRHEKLTMLTPELASCVLCYLTHVNCQVLCANCHMSPVTWPPLYEASDVMKVPRDLRMQLCEVCWLSKKQKQWNQFLFWKFEKGWILPSCGVSMWRVCNHVSINLSNMYIVNMSTLKFLDKKIWRISLKITFNYLVTLLTTITPFPRPLFNPYPNPYL